MKLITLPSYFYDEKMQPLEAQKTAMIPLHFSPEVLLALDQHQPVVALESTIITHGMPYPENIQVAHKIEQTIREQGAIPATIAILHGRIHIGLSESEITELATAQTVIKCSRRDLPFVLSKQLYGSTTVAATMIIAQLAGISVFATGGIGGVHRDADQTWDISADLMEFANTSVTVISAGAKAILDIPKTLEYLETLGVPVIGYDTDYFPAFYYRSSGIALPMRLNTPVEIAQFIQVKKKLGLQGGVLIANPIPEAFEMNATEIEKAIDQGLKDARHHKITGKDLTPFLLSRLNEITRGASQSANTALVLHNAQVAAQIAKALHEVHNN